MRCLYVSWFLNTESAFWSNCHVTVKFLKHVILTLWHTCKVLGMQKALSVHYIDHTHVYVMMMICFISKLDWCKILKVFICAFIVLEVNVQYLCSGCHTPHKWYKNHGPETVNNPLKLWFPSRCVCTYELMCMLITSSVQSMCSVHVQRMCVSSTCHLHVFIFLQMVHICTYLYL